MHPLPPRWLSTALMGILKGPIQRRTDKPKWPSRSLEKTDPPSAPGVAVTKGHGRSRKESGTALVTSDQTMSRESAGDQGTDPAP